MAVVEYAPSDEFTWADILNEPDDGLRREIIGGSLIVNPAPFIRHQAVGFRLATILDGAKAAGTRVLVAPIDWRYDAKGVVGPDVVVVAGDVDVDGPIPATVVPDLVVEVFSSNAVFDRTIKRDLYQQLGVPRYWMIDPGGPHRQPSIVALSLGVDGVYDVSAEATGMEVLATDHPFPVAFAPADLLRP